MDRYKIVSIFSFFMLLSAGCGNRTELNELGITSVTGYDGSRGNWTITYQIMNPSSLSSSSGSSSSVGSQSPVHTFSTHGKTIREAIAASNLENPRKLYFTHNNVVIIGKKTAEQGIDEILDNYFRNPDARETVKVLIADGEAQEFLRKLNPPEKLPGHSLAQILLKNSQMGSYYPVITIYELALKITSDSGTAGVPQLAVKGEDKLNMDSTDIYKHTFSKGKLKISGLCVFEKSKNIGLLNEKESLGISWLTDQIRSTTISILDGESQHSAVLIRKAKVKVTPLKKDNHFTILVKAKVDGELVETTTQEDLTSMQGLENQQRQVEEAIKTQILEGWNAAQSLKTDLVGIGDKIHRKFPKEWKKMKASWPEELEVMDLEVNVDLNIKRVGQLQNSFSDLLSSE